MKKMILHGLKRIAVNLFAFIFASLAFNSCQMFTDSWNAPVKDYFKEYTENAAVVGVEFEKEYPVDSEGYISVPSYPDINVSLILRNPRKYVLDTSVEFNNRETSADYGLDEFPTVLQNSEDFSVINMTLTSAFLKNHEWGGDVSSKISMVEQKSGRVFSPYNLALRCNTPPEMFGAIVCNLPDGSGNTKYVLCFNIPKTEYLKKGATHSDIEKIIIDGNEFPVSIDDDGTVNTNSTSLVTEEPSGMSGGSAGDFIPTGTALYYITGDVLSSEGTIYNLGVEDSKGLGLFYKVSANAEALNEVSFLDNNGNPITGETRLALDSECSYSTVQIVPPASAEDAYTVYEIYSVDNAEKETLVEKARNKGITKVRLSFGKNKIYAYAQKDYFADSPKSSRVITVVSPVAFGDIEIPDYKVEINADKTSVTSADTITMRAAVYEAGEEIQSPDLTDWSIRIYNHGIDTGVSVSSKYSETRRLRPNKR